MRKINEDKLAKLSTTNKMLDDKYGTHGTETRNEFDEQSLAWFYGNMLKERRKELKMTQREVADKLNISRSYVSRIEKKALEKLKAESDFSRAKSRALWYLSRADHSKAALYKKLCRAYDAP